MPSHSDPATFPLLARPEPAKVNSLTGPPESAAPDSNRPHEPSNLTGDAQALGSLGSTTPASPAPTERRSRRRASISAPVRVRCVDLTGDGPDEITTTLDVSRGGVLFVTKLDAFKVGMTVGVTFPYSRVPIVEQAEQSGRIARITKLLDGHLSVAVILRSGVGDLVDSGGHRLAGAEPEAAPSPKLASKKPLVLIVDKDLSVRDALKSHLTIEGYDVIAVAGSQEGHHVLDMFTPALIIAEIEGEDLPGYELCAFVKGTPRLRSVHVILITSSAYPSDYANAHSLGAVVCMAKPFRQERMAHVVRLLAPIRWPQEDSATGRPAYPSSSKSASRTSRRPK